MPTTAAVASEVQSNSDVASPDISHRDVFPFLELSRELRDIVYGFAYGGKVLLPDELVWGGMDEDDLRHQLHSHVVNSPLPSLMRVCKQISTEYQQSVEKLTTLIIADCADSAGYVWHDPHSPSFSAVTRVKHAKVVILLHCWCRTDEEGNPGLCYSISKDASWMSIMVDHLSINWPQLASISVHFGIYWPDTSIWPRFSQDAPCFQDALNRLSTASKVSRVEVFKCPTGTQVLRDGLSLDDVWVSWTAKDGWQAPN